MYNFIYCLFYIYIFIIGSCIGSFLNVCIYRLPKNESIIKGSSHCMTCNTPIKKYDLIPIFSYIILRGKCRHCHAKISPRYCIVEFINSVLWVLSFIYFGISVKALLISLLLSALIVVFLTDIDTQLINMGCIVFICILAIPNIIFCSDLSIVNHLLASVIVSAPMFLISIISHERAMGKGDCYLMLAGGLFLGLKPVAIAFMIGLFAGAIGGLIQKHFTKSSVFAFGPYLSAGIAVASFFGTEIFDTYIKLVSI